ncbi:MAG: peptidoglycan editing factor PgeF [Selenomonadaceae bacterium]|nr:peptidoglycan editing factor PgeF [Selenomonadaceae bacterium]
MSYFLKQSRRNFWHGKFTSFPDDFIVHAISTRQSGVSKPPFDSLNLALHVGDNNEDVITNRKRFAASLDLNAEDICTPNQVHGDRVMRVDESHRGRGSLSYEDSIKDTDALITNTPNLPLMLCFADCVPVLFVDEENRAIGIAHAGWKGTFLKIAAKTLMMMTKEFGTDPAKCLAGIAPSIGACCYDVGENVQTACAESFPRHVDDILIKRNGKVYAGLWQANKIQLIEAGMSESNIDVARECTCCKSGWYYSYRAASKSGSAQTGRIAAIISIRNVE